MYSLVWEVRSDKFALDGFCNENNIEASIWQKGDRITSRRNHTANGFKYVLGDFSTLEELENALFKFTESKEAAINSIKSMNGESEIDIGVVINASEVAATSLALPLELQLLLSQLGAVLSFTVMISDD